MLEASTRLHATSQEGFIQIKEHQLVGSLGTLRLGGSDVVDVDVIACVALTAEHATAR